MDRKHWALIPTTSIGGLDFGRSRVVVRKELGDPVKTIKKAASTNSITDVYPSFHVFYSADLKLEAIEFFSRDISLSINTQPVFPGTLSAARRLLPDLEECFGSYVSQKASIGICTEGDSIVSILAGCKDYYKDV